MSVSTTSVCTFELMLERNWRLQPVSHEGCGILCISERFPETIKYSFEPILQNLQHRKVHRGHLLQQSWIWWGSSPSVLGSALSHQHTGEGLRPVRGQEKLSSNSILKWRFRLGKHTFKIWKDPQIMTFQGNAWWEKEENERHWICFGLEITKPLKNTTSF